MKLLSLDLSSKSTGYCIFDDKKIIGYGCLTAGGSDVYARIEKITIEVKALFDKYAIDEVIIEDVIPSDCGNKQSVYKALMYLQAEVFLTIYRINKYMPVTFVVASHWRSVVGIKTGRYEHRDDLKNASIELVKKKYGIDVNDDTADAICIGISYYTDQNDAVENNTENEDRAF